MKLENFLKEIGFENMTGSLWKHPTYGIMQFHLGEEDTKQSIVYQIYQRGWNECQANIRDSLGIYNP